MLLLGPIAEGFDDWLAANRYGPFILPNPLAVGRDLLALFISPNLLWHVAASSTRVVLSLLIALVLGGGLAILAREVPILEEVVHGRILVFLNSFPSVGWAILSVIWFRVSNASVIFVQVAILLPFCLINIAEGLAELDPETMEMARSFTRHRGRVFFKVVLPLMLPYLLGALRVSYGIAWKIALVSELFGADSGLGYLMIQAETAANATRVLSTSLAIVLLFILGEKLVIDPLGRRFAPPLQRSHS
jgi:NitT/TauT family transport system permease protein/sulfonate transport system permease protein